METVKIYGKVLDEQRQPFANVQIRFISDLATLGATPDATVVMRTGVPWTRQQDGITGHRWNVYNKYVARTVAGIGYEEFKALVVRYNPALMESQYRFEADQPYTLPQNIEDSADIAWTRRLIDFDGTLWQCWQTYVAGKVIGMSWERFRQEMGEQNPELVENDYQFTANRAYQLPVNPWLSAYEVVTTTSASGRYKVDQLPMGNYRVEVVYNNDIVYKEMLEVTEDVEHDFSLFGIFEIAQANNIIGVSGPQFTLNGNTFRRFVGVNITGILHYGETYHDENDHLKHVIEHSNHGHRDIAIEEAQQAKATVIRCFLPHYSCTKEMVAQRLRIVLDKLPNDMYLLPAFIDFYNDRGMYPGPKEEVDRDFYFKPAGSNYRHLNPAFFKPPYSTQYLDLVDQIVTEFKHEPKIFAWQIGNELKVDPSDQVTLDDYIRFNHMVADRIKTIDPNHLVTTGMKSTQHPHMIDRLDLAEALYSGHSASGTPLIDFVTIHSYVDPGEPEVETRGFKQDAMVAKTLNMPIINEESGVNKQVPDFETALNQHMDHWFNIHADAPMQAIQGFLQWGFCPDGIADGDGNNHSDKQVIYRVYGSRRQSFLA